MIMCVITATWLSCAPVPHPDDASWTLPKIVDFLHSNSAPVGYLQPGKAAAAEVGWVVKILADQARAAIGKR